MAKEYKFGVSIFEKEEEELEQLSQPETLPEEEPTKPYEFGRSLFSPRQDRTQYRKASVDLRSGELSGEIPEAAKPGFMRDAVAIGKQALSDIPIRAKQAYLGIQDEFINDFLEGPKLTTSLINPFSESLSLGLTPKPELKAAAQDLLKENEKEYKALEKKLRKLYKEADLTETQAAISSGISSFLTQAPFLVASAYTRNPKYAYSSLGYFGVQEKGLSYKSARQQGLSHDQAKKNSNINALFEVGTELIPTKIFTDSLLKYLNKNDKTVKGFVKDGAATMLSETASENVNTFLQETNNALFGIQNELRVAWTNKDNPLYNGPSWLDVLGDQAYLTTISSLVAGGANVSLRGAIQYADDVKRSFRSMNPTDAENVLNQMNTLVRNNQRTYQAMDLMTLDALDPDIIDDNELDPLDYFADNYLKIDLEQPVGIKEKVEKTIEQFKGPAIQVVGQKEFESFVTEIDQDTDPEKQEAVQSILDDIEGDIDIVGPINVKEPPTSFDGQQLNNIQKFVVDTRKFSEDMVENIWANKDDFNQEMQKYRDLDIQESFNLSTAIYRLEQAGMPLSVVEDLDFIGMFGVDERGGRDQEFNIAEYLVGANTLGFSGLSQIKQLSTSAQTAYLASGFAHEIAHHLDYRYSEVISDDNKGSVVLPMHYDSPLFNIPEYTIKTDPYGDNARRIENGKDPRPAILDIPDDQEEGKIIQEAFKVYNNFGLQIRMLRGTPGRHYNGNLLAYPLSQFSSMMFARARGDSNKSIIDQHLRFLKGEIFAQMHALYYTNRQLLEQGAPETIKLIERTYDAISVDGIRNKSSRLLTAFQSPRAGRSLQVPSQGPISESDKSGVGAEPAGSRVGTEAIQEDGQRDGLPVQEPNYINIGELTPKKDGTYDGAPRNKLGKFKNTQKDFDNLANQLVGFAEQRELSIPDLSRNWYQNALDSIDQLTQGDPKLKEDVLRMFVIYSSQTPVETNLAYVLRSLVAMAKGGDPLPGFQPKAGEFAKAAIEADDFGQRLPGVGFKLQSFYDNMTGKKPESVTMDTWMFNLLGFQKDQGALANHRYGTSVIQEATRLFNEKNNDNMTPMQFQAVLWTYARNKKLKEQGKQPEYIGYETYIDRAMATVAGEVIPTPSVPDLAFAEQLDPSVKMQMTRELLETITTEEGKNEIMNLLPGTGLYKFSHSFGAYDGTVNPNIISSLVLEKVSGTKQFNKLDLTYADDFLRAWGYVFRQDAVPYHVANQDITDAEIADLSNESANIGTELSFIDTTNNQPIEMTEVLRNQINTELAKEGIDGFTQVDANTIGIINYKFNNSIIENFDQKIADAMGRVQIEGVRADISQNIKYNTQYLTNNWEENPDGNQYLTGRLEQESIREGLDSIRTKVDEVYSKYRDGRYDDDPSGGFPTRGPESPDLETLASRAPVYEGDQLIEPAYADFFEIFEDYSTSMKTNRTLNNLLNMSEISWKEKSEYSRNGISNYFARYIKAKEELAKPDQRVSFDGRDNIILDFKTREKYNLETFPRVFVMRMPINDFIKLTTPDDLFIEEQITSFIKDDKFDPLSFGYSGDTPFSFPVLAIDSKGQVTGHDGRGRSLTALQDGATEVPVILFIERGKDDNLQQNYESMGGQIDNFTPITLGIKKLLPQKYEGIKNRPETFGKTQFRKDYFFNLNRTDYDIAPLAPLYNIAGKDLQAKQENQMEENKRIVNRINPPIDSLQGPDTPKITKLGMAPPARKPSGKETDINNQWTMGDESNASLFLQSFREKVVNNFDRVVQIENKIEDQFGPESMKGKRVTQRTDVFHGKVKYSLDQAMEEVDTLLKGLVDKNIKLEDFNDFLRNLHAPERNDYINTLREAGKPGSVKYKDRGSGIPTEQAIEKLREYGVELINREATAFNEMGSKYLASFKELNKFIEGTIDIYNKEGLLEEGTSEDWRGRYKYYVPLVGFASDTREDARPSVNGKGMTIYGPELKKAKGRVSISGPPVEQAIVQRQNAVVRAEKNVVTKSFADLAREFPNPEMYEVVEDAPQIKPKLTDWNPDKGSYVGFKENGEIKYVHILDERLARAFQGWSTGDMHWLTRQALGFTRFLSMVNTVYNPEFMVTNALRDVQTGFYNLLAEQEIPGGRAQGQRIAKQAFNPKTLTKRLGQFYKGLKRKEIKEAGIQKYYDAYEQAGAPTGYIDQPTVEDLTKNLEKLVAMHQGKVGRKLASISYEPVLKYIEHANTAIENGARFSVFVESINAQGGIDNVSQDVIDAAAVLAKNLTINFNRKGTWGPTLNATYMFFNAAVQGSVNFFRGFIPGKRFSKTKGAFAAGMVGMAAARTIYNLMISGEDEDEQLIYAKIPSHEKERNMIFLLPDAAGVEEGEFKVEKFGAAKKYYAGEKPIAVAIPLPYGYNIFDNLGRVTVEMFADRMFDLKTPVLTPEKAAFELTGAFAGSFSPIGLGYTNDEGIPGAAKRLGKTVIPTYGKPFYEISINENWFGAPITREQLPFGPELPESGLRFKSTSDAFVWVTKELNELTGGNDYYSGWMDIQPTTLQYFADYIGGGALRTTRRTADFFKDLSEGKVGEREFNETPFLRVLTAEPQGYVNARQFHEREAEVEQISNAYANLTGQERKDFKRDKGWKLIKLGQWRNDIEKNAYKKATGSAFKSPLFKAQEDLKDIREKEKEAERRYRSKDPDKYTKLMDRYEEDKQEAYMKFNKEYNSVMNDLREDEEE